MKKKIFRGKKENIACRAIEKGQRHHENLNLQEHERSICQSQALCHHEKCDVDGKCFLRHVLPDLCFPLNDILRGAALAWPTCLNIEIGQTNGVLYPFPHSQNSTLISSTMLFASVGVANATP